MSIINTVIESISNKDDYPSTLKNITKNIIKLSIEKDSKDNLSIIVILFQNFYEKLINQNKQIFEKALKNLKSNAGSFNNYNDVLYNNYLSIFKYVEEEIKQVKQQPSMIINNISNNINIIKKTKIYCCGLGLKKKSKH